MIRGKCPICGKPFAIAGLDDLPSFPFCSDRCRLIDLGRWVDESYAIPERAGGPDGEGDDDRPPGVEDPDED